MAHGQAPLPTAPSVAQHLGHPSTADHLVAYLAVEGVDTVFGVPGGPIVGLFDALARAPHVRTVLCKHEHGAVAAAAGHALVSGRIGVAIVTGGPGVTNTLTALAGAWHDRIPVLVIAGQVATGQVGRGAVHDGCPLGTDVLAMAAPATAMAVAAATGAQARSLLPGLLRRAHCTQRPVLLMLAPGTPATGCTTMRSFALFRKAAIGGHYHGAWRRDLGCLAHGGIGPQGGSVRGAPNAVQAPAVAAPLRSVLPADHGQVAFREARGC